MFLLFVFLQRKNFDFRTKSRDPATRLHGWSFVSTVTEMKRRFDPVFELGDGFEAAERARSPAGSLRSADFLCLRSANKVSDAESAETHGGSAAGWKIGSPSGLPEAAA